MDTQRHEGMWFNPELPGYHCPRCRVSITLEKLADIPRKYWTEHARILLAYKHPNGPPDLMEVRETSKEQFSANRPPARVSVAASKS